MKMATTLLLTALLIMAPVSVKAALTDDQVSAILVLLTSFGVAQDTVDNVKSALVGDNAENNEESEEQEESELAEEEERELEMERLKEEAKVKRRAELEEQERFEQERRKARERKEVTEKLDQVDGLYYNPDLSTKRLKEMLEKYRERLGRQERSTELREQRELEQQERQCEQSGGGWNGSECVRKPVDLYCGRNADPVWHGQSWGCPCTGFYCQNA